MFLRKNWRPPITVLILAMTAVGFYILRAQSEKEPVTMITPVAPEGVANSHPKPPPGETAANGHWHGDEWHAEPHEPIEVVEDIETIGSVTDVSIADRLLDLPTETLQDALIKAYVETHREQYPDCQEHEAVLEDARRDAETYLADREYMEKYWALDAERKQLHIEAEELQAELDAADAKYKGIDAKNTMSKEERIRILRGFLDKIRVRQEKREALQQRRDALEKEKPVHPPRLHVH